MKLNSRLMAHFKRIDKVLDCWFESGSMPFAQLHYPFENQKNLKRITQQILSWNMWVRCVRGSIMCMW